MKRNLKRMYAQRNECGLTKLPSAADSYSRAGHAWRTSGLEREIQINFQAADHQEPNLHNANTTGDWHSLEA
jgi:hypothetical protein